MNQPYIHRRYAAALRARHDRVDLHVGKMIAMGGENIGQADHRLHQRIDVTRALPTHALKHFVAAQVASN